MKRDENSLDDRMRLLLRDLSRALFEAISDSHDVHRSLRQLRSEGYRLQLLVDCKPTLAAAAPATVPGEEPEPPRVQPEPAFRIDGEDLSFLRSIGIDPTRRRRRRTA